MRAARQDAILLVPLLSYLVVVLVGGGHSHVLALRMLAMQPIAGLRITLISPASHSPYSGMLPGLISGHYRFEESHIDLARLCQWAGVRFITAEVIGLDPSAKCLSLSGRHSIRYDVVSLDIGTNTEITVAANGRMIACSTASGPAFEGAHIRDGMRAAEGAIERVQITDNKLAIQTVGHTAPIGICGSGILDVIAQLKLCGAMNNKGGLDEDHPLIRRGEKLLEALLASAETTGHGNEIVLTRGDINEIQMAKGAMRAGLELLFEASGVSAADVDEFIIAGAFGTYINVESAIAIGMFPDIPAQKPTDLVGRYVD